MNPADRSVAPSFVEVREAYRDQPVDTPPDTAFFQISIPPISLLDERQNISHLSISAQEHQFTLSAQTATTVPSVKKHT
jgi:hypothetical protein